MNINLPATIEDGAGLTPKQAKFAALYSEYGNAARAYRQAFDCAPETSPVTVRRMAYELVHTPKVATRIRALQAVAAEATVVSVRSRMVRLQLIVDADPSELVSIAGSACRHCHGEGHAYQWRDEAELATAVDRFMRSLDASKQLQAPETAGGFGFRGNREPNVNCPHCDGEGVARTVVSSVETRRRHDVVGDATGLAIGGAQPGGATGACRRVGLFCQPSASDGLSAVCRQRVANRQWTGGVGV